MKNKIITTLTLLIAILTTLTGKSMANEKLNIGNQFSQIENRENLDFIPLPRPKPAAIGPKFDLSFENNRLCILDYNNPIDRVREEDNELDCFIYQEHLVDYNQFIFNNEIADTFYHINFDGTFRTMYNISQKTEGLCWLEQDINRKDIYQCSQMYLTTDDMGVFFINQNGDLNLDLELEDGVLLPKVFNNIDHYDITGLIFQEGESLRNNSNNERKIRYGCMSYTNDNGHFISCASNHDFAYPRLDIATASPILSLELTEYKKDGLFLCGLDENQFISCWKTIDEELVQIDIDPIISSKQYKKISFQDEHLCGIEKKLNQAICFNGIEQTNGFYILLGKYAKINYRKNHMCGLTSEGEINCMRLIDNGDEVLIFEGNQYTDFDLGYSYDSIIGCGIKTNGDISCKSSNAENDTWINLENSSLDDLREENQIGNKPLFHGQL